MTAQVYFVSAEARNALRVPMAALVAPVAVSATAANMSTATTRGSFGGSVARGMQRRNGTVTVKNADGTLETRQVVVGVADRVHGEVLEGLNEGEQVVVGKRQAEAAAFR